MRIGIVNDVPMVIEALRRAVALQPRHRVLWTATSGAQAVALCAARPPDLVLMDLLMPGMDGVEATRQIMAASPCAILVVTVSIGTNAWRVFEAMGAGALDAVNTPTLGLGATRQSAGALLTKLDIIERMLADKQSGRRPGLGAAAEALRLCRQPLLAMGASAGGPAALAKVLTGLPKPFPAPIILIQHVDEQFAAGMAQWLADQSGLSVEVAAEGARPTVGKVLLAGTADHLVLKADGSVGYTPEPRDFIYRPSVDVFFESLTQFWPGPIVGVLLTGMGRDGALGLRALRNQGHHTIAQDQATCAVYGMPKAAAALDAALEILPIDRVAPRLAHLLASHSR
jgi:two-component system response regulator WspF